uniref:Uncharacterized protein n=1 Tax=Schistosoma mansoni TaxID=6183 RepID=A0A5K4FAL8_SCHMA
MDKWECNYLVFFVRTKKELRDGVEWVSDMFADIMKNIMCMRTFFMDFVHVEISITPMSNMISCAQKSQIYTGRDFQSLYKKVFN